MTADDTSYYRRRAVEERARALSCERQDVREIHEELARQYDALVERAELRPVSRTVVAVVGSQPAAVLANKTAVEAPRNAS